MTFPHAVKLVVDDFAAVFPDAHTGNKPPEEGDRFITVTRIGGGKTARGHDEAVLLIEYNERTPTRLHDLTEAGRKRIGELAAAYPAVTFAKEESGPVDLDDPARPGVLRATTQVALGLRNTRSTP
jgi:hypothetical protein